MQMNILTVCQRVKNQVRFAKCAVWDIFSGGFIYRKKRINENWGETWVGCERLLCSVLHSSLAKQSHYGRQ